MNNTDEQFAVNSDDLNAKVQDLTNVLEDYWTRWREEYLGEIQYYKQWSPDHQYLEKWLSFMMRTTHVVSGDLEG